MSELKKEIIKSEKNTKKSNNTYKGCYKCVYILQKNGKWRKSNV